MKKLPYTVRIPKEKQREAEAWCESNLGARWEAIGNRKGIWCCFWSGPRSNFGSYDFHFANEQDTLIFSLKWTS